MKPSELPDALPVPVDDGLADHLLGMRLPRTALSATHGDKVNIGSVTGLLVIYIYPMTGRPDVSLPDGWDAIPGARGCTPQACSFRDHYGELQALEAEVYGMSAQSPEYQLEAKQRLHLPFELLSDSELSLKLSLALPTFNAAGMTLYKRLTFIARNGRIDKVFYPVFPPDRNADEVLSWLRENA